MFRHNIYISSILVNRGNPAKFSLIWRGTTWMGIIHYTQQRVKHVRQQFWQAHTHTHTHILKHPYMSCQTTTSKVLWDYTLNIIHLWPRTWYQFLFHNTELFFCKWGTGQVRSVFIIHVTIFRTNVSRDWLNTELVYIFVRGVFVIHCISYSISPLSALSHKWIIILCHR